MRTMTKLTPHDLAKEPLTFQTEESAYDYINQRRSITPCSMAFTANATRTYNASGKPMDSDNDH